MYRQCLILSTGTQGPGRESQSNDEYNAMKKNLLEDKMNILKELKIENKLGEKLFTNCTSSSSSTRTVISNT